MDTDRKVPGPNDNKQGWMMFGYSGPLDLRAIRPEDIHVGDIVHVLGGINRSIGQTREPITVLWHSVMVAQFCRFEHFDTQLEALLHDAAEAADCGAPNRNGMSTWLPQTTSARTPATPSWPAAVQTHLAGSESATVANTRAGRNRAPGLPLLDGGPAARGTARASVARRRSTKHRTGSQCYPRENANGACRPADRPKRLGTNRAQTPEA